MTTTDTTTTGTAAAVPVGVLTRDDIAALKLADDVSFHHTRHVTGGAQIRAHMRGGYSDAPRIWTAREQRLFPFDRDYGSLDRVRELIVESTAFGYRDDGVGWRSDNEPDLGCFHLINAALYSDTWLTVAGLLRAGDRLSLAWVADNNTDTIRQADLHADEFRLKVHRGDARPMVFRLGTAITPDNSARMIRRHGI